jgi:pyridoxamine 5'-phosphate oxidase
MEIHTNLYSAKVDELRHTPVAALHVWDNGSSLQIRLLADVTITSGADAAAAWSAVPDRSRRAYSSDHRPGKSIASSLAYEQTPDPQAFAILSLELRQMDLLHLGVQHHRRALFSRDNEWAGQWLPP